MSLFSGRRGFFGRTYCGVKIELDGATYKPKNPDVVDWAVMHTKLKDFDIRAIVEYSLIIMKIRREVTEVAIPTDRSAAKKDEFEFKESDRKIAKESEVSLKQTSLQIGIAEISLFG